MVSQTACERCTRCGTEFQAGVARFYLVPLGFGAVEQGPMCTACAEVVMPPEVPLALPRPALPE